MDSTDSRICIYYLGCHWTNKYSFSRGILFSWENLTKKRIASPMVTIQIYIYIIIK